MASLSFTGIAESTASVNLSSPARTDWAHYGDANTSSVTPTNRKSGGGSLITCALYASTPGLSWFDDSARPINWSDGTPTGSSTNNPNGVYDTTNGGGGTTSGGGFTLTFQLSAGSNAIEIYCGSYAGRLTVAASVSDSSSSAISNTTTLDDSGATGMSGYVLIECTPGSAGQTLTVNVYANNIYSGYGNTTVSGAAITQSGGGPTDYPLAYAAASYSVTASAETLAAGRALPVTAASYALTGSAVTLGVGRKLAYAATSYTLTAAAETLATGRKLDVAATSYSLTPANITLTYTPSAVGLAVDPAAYTLTAAAESFGVERKLAYDAASYTLSAGAETLAVGRAVDFAAVSYALTASAETLTATRALSVDPVSYGLTAAPVTLTYESLNKELSVEPASYVLTAADVGLAYSGAGSGGNAWGKKKRRQQIQAEVNARNLEILRAEIAQEMKAETVVEGIQADEYDDDEDVLMLLL